jgi:putative MFS transporter
MFFEGFDIYLAASVLGATYKSGFSTIFQNGLFISATFIGMAAGAFLSGFLGDRFGRRITYQVSLLVFGVAAILSALAPNIEILILLRIIMGLGLGAETVVGVSIIIEMFPADVRGRWAGLIASAITAGLPASALAGWLLIPAFGWRAMFVVGGCGALIAWLLRRGFPESPRWLEAQGRLAEAEALVVEMERSSFETGISKLQAGRSGPADAPSVDDSAPLSRVSSLIVGCVAHVVVNMTVYGFIVWVPTFFVSQGVTLTNSIGITFAMALGGPIGTAMGAVCADAFGRKNSIIGAALCAVFLSIAFVASPNPIIMTVVGFLLTIPIYVLVGIVFAIYTPELFPTEFRLRGVGISSGAGRFASILVPLAVAPLFLRFGLAGVIFAMCVGLLTMTAVVAWLGHEPKRQ